MMTRKSIFMALAAMAASMCSCKQATPPPSSPNEPMAAAKGREAALEAVSLPAGSMQQETALLRIRTTEHRIREAGDSLAANAYARAAEAVLDSALHIKN